MVGRLCLRVGEKVIEQPTVSNVVLHVARGLTYEPSGALGGTQSLSHALSTLRAGAIGADMLLTEDDAVPPVYIGSPTAGASPDTLGTEESLPTSSPCDAVVQDAQHPHCKA